MPTHPLDADTRMVLLRNSNHAAHAWYAAQLQQRAAMLQYRGWVEVLQCTQHTMVNSA
jgi:hypothetical protein